MKHVAARELGLACLLRPLPRSASLCSAPLSSAHFACLLPAAVSCARAALAACASLMRGCSLSLSLSLSLPLPFGLFVLLSPLVRDRRTGERAKERASLEEEEQEQEGKEKSSFASLGSVCQSRPVNQEVGRSLQPRFLRGNKNNHRQIFSHHRCSFQRERVFNSQR